MLTPYFKRLYTGTLQSVVLIYLTIQYMGMLFSVLYAMVDMYTSHQHVYSITQFVVYELINFSKTGPPSHVWSVPPHLLLHMSLSNCVVSGQVQNYASTLQTCFFGSIPLLPYLSFSLRTQPIQILDGERGQAKIFLATYVQLTVQAKVLGCYLQYDLSCWPMPSSSSSSSSSVPLKPHLTDWVPHIIFIILNIRGSAQHSALIKYSLNLDRRSYIKKDKENRSLISIHSVIIMTNTVDRETTCGLGPWRPSFMQRLASKKVYMFFYGALGIVQVGYSRSSYIRVTTNNNNSKKTIRRAAYRGRGLCEC